MGDKEHLSKKKKKLISVTNAKFQSGHISNDMLSSHEKNNA